MLYMRRHCGSQNAEHLDHGFSELIVDFSTKQERTYQTPVINESPVERVDSFRYLSVHITQDLSCSCHINTVVEKTWQHLYHLRRLRDFRLTSKVLRNFYSCTIESILTGNIATWFRNSTMQDRQALQRVARSAERIIHTKLPDLHSIYSKRCWTKTRKIVKDLSHPNNGLFSLLRSGKENSQLLFKETFLPAFFKHVPSVEVWIKVKVYTVSIKLGYLYSIKKIGLNTITNPTVNTITNTKVNTITNTKVNTITNPTVNTITNPRVNTITNTKVNTITNTKMNTITNPTLNTITKTKVNTITNTKVNTITNPTVNTITNPRVNTITNTKVNTITSTKVNTITNTTVNTITNPRVNTITITKVNTITNPTLNTITNPSMKPQVISLSLNTITNLSLNTITNSSLNIIINLSLNSINEPQCHKSITEHHVTNSCPPQSNSETPCHLSITKYSH
ncbi:hypothetical protein QTP86_003684 [Hemibagrus guttatus]|nr:hypothetical protein QTP86_003684 [Hemibagrus guttatus]